MNYLFLDRAVPLKYPMKNCEFLDSIAERRDLDAQNYQKSKFFGAEIKKAFFRKKGKIAQKNKGKNIVEKIRFCDEDCGSETHPTGLKILGDT